MEKSPPGPPHFVLADVRLCLLPLLKPRQVFSTAAWTFLFSLSIETMQLLYTWSGGPSARSCDVTDLITNTLGGVLGYLLFWLLRPWVERALGRR